MTALTVFSIVFVFSLLLILGLLSVLRELIGKTHDEPVFREEDGDRRSDVSRSN